jgi:hypothetical protein
MNKIGVIFRKLASLLLRYRTAMLGNEIHTCEFVNLGKGETAYIVSPIDTYIGLYVPITSEMDGDLRHMIQRAKEHNRVQVADFNGNIVLVGKNSSVEEAFVFYKNSYKSLDEAWGAFMSNESRRPDPKRDMESTEVPIF